MDPTTDGGIQVGTGDATGADSGAQGGDLKSAIIQLQQSIAQISTQVEAVASAAGVSPSETEGSPVEEAGESPATETSEDGATPSAPAAGPGQAASLAAFMKKPAGPRM
jgi:hypothetical protein